MRKRVESSRDLSEAKQLVCIVLYLYSQFTLKKPQPVLLELEHYKTLIQRILDLIFLCQVFDIPISRFCFPVFCLFVCSAGNQSQGFMYARH